MQPKKQISYSKSYIQWLAFTFTYFQSINETLQSNKNQLIVHKNSRSNKKKKKKKIHVYILFNILDNKMIQMIRNSDLTLKKQNKKQLITIHFQDG